MSADWRIVRNKETDDIVLDRAKLCVSFWCHLRGLQFVLKLPENQGLLFATDSEGRATTAIHMFFMFMSIAVVWLDASGTVVDKKLAKPWRPIYTPTAPAQYYIEANTSLLDRVEIGDTLNFNEVAG
jgi:uncharacterized membrane protein (UPF0127 family)